MKIRVVERAAQDHLVSAWLWMVFEPRPPFLNLMVVVVVFFWFFFHCDFDAWMQKIFRLSPRCTVGTFTGVLASFCCITIHHFTPPSEFVHPTAIILMLTDSLDQDCGWGTTGVGCFCSIIARDIWEIDSSAAFFIHMSGTSDGITRRQNPVKTSEALTGALYTWLACLH